MIARTDLERNSMKSTICKAIACMVLMFSLPTWSDTFPDIVVLGDDARVLLLKQCTQPCRSGANSVATAPLGSSASSIASLAQRAKHAVIVLDATQGPLQIIREHILIARQAGVPSLSLLFVNTNRVKDSELLKMEEQEARALLSTYDMNGDHAALFTVKTLRRGGDELSGALAALKNTPDRPEESLAFTNGKQLATFIYLVTPLESKWTLALQKDSPVTVWINGQVSQGRVSSTHTLNPGDSGDLFLQLSAPVSAAAGSRFLLEREGRIIALGVVKSVGVQAAP